MPHLYGYGADMDEIMDMATGNNIIVIEDAASVTWDKDKRQNDWNNRRFWSLLISFSQEHDYFG